MCENNVGISLYFRVSLASHVRLFQDAFRKLVLLLIASEPVKAHSVAILSIASFASYLVEVDFASSLYLIVVDRSLCADEAWITTGHFFLRKGRKSLAPVVHIPHRQSHECATPGCFAR